jgi:Lipase maturation factor
MLVNSYGAFGSVGRERLELVLEGTADPSASQGWQAYELPFKPGDVSRWPGVVSPLQPRLDWQLWFAAMSRIDDEPWLLALVRKLLDGEPVLTRLFARDPFAGGPPPK